MDFSFFNRFKLPALPVQFSTPLGGAAWAVLLGIPLKRAVAVGVSRRFTYHTQPNIDAGTALIAEVHGTVTPGRIARVALEAYDDRAWILSTGERLTALYRDHIGASDRMADSLLALAA